MSSKSYPLDFDILSGCHFIEGNSLEKEKKGENIFIKGKSHFRVYLSARKQPQNRETRLFLHSVKTFLHWSKPLYQFSRSEIFFRQYLAIIRLVFINPTTCQLSEKSNHYCVKLSICFQIRLSKS